MKHARFFDYAGSGVVPVTVYEDATLADVLAAANAADRDDLVLSQNGRPAHADDPLKPDATVMLMPKAVHG